MTPRSKLLLAAVTALFIAPSAGLAEEASPPPPEKKAGPIAARRKHAQTSASKPVAQKPAEASDCPRAHYKGDPVCFGAEDDAALPLPSRASGEAAPKRVEDVTLTAKPRLNQPVESPNYFNNPNPRPSTNDVGGGVGVGFHF
ncbi:hypothetical protein [Methylocystis bryophila]|uniref:hypothetical protein n=1 Tax=Methylocystis bryophila TaxID=655015 RepID=UPI001319C004|nr:hypothetical protein [Methylocystis bryophila]